MLTSSHDRILQRLGDDDVVLDIGGGASPFARADWVVDLSAYEDRGLLGRVDSAAERFNASTWVQRDVCSKEPLPFADASVDFVVCTHTLEDVRDPIWVCEEMSRVAKAGYVETPSRLEEQSWGVQGPWVGWGHHHWLIEEADGGLEFVFKPHIVHGRASDHFPAGFHARLSAEERVLAHFWEDSLPARERIFIGPGKIDAYLAGFVSHELAARALADRPGRFSRLRRRGGS